MYALDLRPVVALPRPVVAYMRPLQEGQCLQAGQGREGGIKKGLGALEQGELAWGFRTWRISEGFGAFGAGGINKGLGAWAPSRSVISL